MPLTRLSALLLGLALFAAPALAQQSTPTQAVDPAWMKVDARGKRVTWELIAGHTPLNGALNFNGFRDGEVTFTVPIGWTVVLSFVNNDGMLSHSAEVIVDSIPVPLGAEDPAFPKAYTRDLERGVPRGTAKEEMRFTAGTAGSYLIFCAVPGHGAAGMWIRLTVDPSATTPKMTATPVPAAR